MKTLFLDFDGVLYDTLKEAYVLCRKVFYGADIHTPIEQELYAKFYKYKYLVYNIWQYYYLMQSLNANNVDEEYNILLKHRDLISESDFELNFIKARKDALEKHSDFIDSLETPYEFFDFVKKLSVTGKYDIVIVSRKNSFAIRRKIGELDIKIIGKEELDSVVDKAEFIRQYMQTNSVENAYFVDDNSHNLKPCEDIPNLTCLLAGWGNIGIDEVGLSQDEVSKIII